jgi:hypothetical protein
MPIGRFIIISVLIACYAGTAGCLLTDVVPAVGNGVAGTESRELAAFSEVAFLGAGRIEINIGDAEPVELSGDTNLLPLIQTLVIDDRLTVQPTRPILPTQPIVIRITVPNSTAVIVGGAGDIVVNGIDNERLRIELRGAGDITVTGTTGDLAILVTGAGRTDTSGLDASDVDVNIAGAGNVDVRATDTLDVSISGTGSVVYRGDPDVTQDITGLGTVSRATE